MQTCIKIVSYEVFLCAVCVLPLLACGRSVQRVYYLLSCFLAKVRQLCCAFEQEQLPLIKFEFELEALLVTYISTPIIIPWQLELPLKNQQDTIKVFECTLACRDP